MLSIRDTIRNFFWIFVFLRVKYRYKIKGKQYYCKIKQCHSEDSILIKQNEDKKMQIKN